MADSVVEDQICVALRESEDGSITVVTLGDFRHVAGIHGSSKTVKQALGSLIRRGIVKRFREPMQGRTDMEERPITFRLNPNYH